MHELSIAMSLTDAACAEAERLGDVRVDALHVRIGALSGVVPDALAFSFQAATAGSAIEGARLVIEEMPLVVFCPRCDAERELPGIQHFRCPVCSEPTPHVVRGRELELVSMEVEDDVGANR